MIRGCWQVALVVCGIAASTTIGAAENILPLGARKVGYTINTFSSESDFSRSTVDQALSFSPGFKWYNSNVVRDEQQAPENNSFGKDGTITTFSPAYGLGLVTAANISSPPGFVGQAFGGGGYFEAELKFDPYAVNLGEGQWPAFWAVSLESSASLLGQHWDGLPPNYNHTVEFDIFEYLYSRTRAPHSYGAAGHDFFGIYGVTCPPARCKLDSENNERVVPSRTNWNDYHKFAMLWVPAANSTEGRVEFYFDDQPVGPAIRWAKFTNQTPDVSRSNLWKFSEIDLQHLILILGSGRQSPITVRSANVWQATDKFNLRN